MGFRIGGSIKRRSGVAVRRDVGVLETDYRFLSFSECVSHFLHMEIING